MVSAVASIAGSVIQGNAAKSAASAQAAAANAANTEQARQFDITQANQKPFLETGTSANQRLAYLMGLNPTSSGASASNRDTIAQQLGYSPTPQGVSGSKVRTVVGINQSGRRVSGYQLSDGTVVPADKNSPRLAIGANYDNGATPTTQGYTAEQNAAIDAEIAKQQADAVANPDYGSLSKSFTLSDYQADPGYAFRLSEGQKALDRAAAAKGGFNSGAAAKGLIDYNQNMASQEYGNAYNRYNTNQTNLYNRLAGLSGTGQTSANTLATAGQNYANAVGGNLNAAGNAAAAGSIAQGNAWATGLNNIASSLYQPSYSSSSNLPWQAPGNVNPLGGYY